MDASDTTKRRQNRALYADRVVQQTTFDKGWKNRVILEGGVHTGAGAMTYAPNFYNMREGAVLTGLAERVLLVASVPNKYPNPPTSVSAALVAGNVVVSFTPPAYAGATPITSYTVISTPGDVRVTGTGSPITMIGLTPGITYTFTVIAINAFGNSDPSDASNSVQAGSVPDAPTAVSGARGNTQVTITFTPPVFDGGVPILDYTFTAYVGASSIGTIVGSGSPTVWTGLTNGTAYTFTVKARNVIGFSAESAASGPVTIATVPGVPTNFAVAPGAGSMKLHFTAPSDGGSAIINYLYSTDDGASFIFSGTTTSPVTVSGLDAGNIYNFKLRALNAIGQGDPTSTLSAAALAAFNPNEIAGINIWFDPQVPASVTSSSGRVTAIADQTSAGNNFAASVTGIIQHAFPSAINGRPGLNFTTSAPTTSTYLYKDDLTLAPTNELTVFMVAIQSSEGSSGNSELFWVKTDFRYFDLFNYTNTGGVGELSLNIGNSTQVTDVNFLSPSSAVVISVVVTTTTVTIYVNGTVTTVNGATRGGGYSLNNATLDWAISGAAFLGTIGDVATFAAVLNTAQRQAMEGYLAWKWGLQATLPIGHPYNSAPPALALPAAPTSLVGTAGNSSASIAFTAGSDGGSAITNYQYSINGGSTFTAFSPAQTSSSVTISGLTNGTAYTIQLKAVTAFGVSSASSSVSVTPTAV